MNYREKTLIRGESLLIKANLYCENSATGKLELYDAAELTSILQSTKQGRLPMMIAEARLSDGKRIPLTIIQELNNGVAEDGALVLFSEVDTWNFPGESFDINIILRQRADLGFRDISDNIIMKDLNSATFNETFYIARSASKFDMVTPEPVYRAISYYIDDVLWQTQQVEVGTAITPLMPDEREGYIFSGWENIPSIMPDNDITVNGQWYDNVRPTNFYLSDSRCCIKLPNGEYVATDFTNHCIKVFSPDGADSGEPKITYGHYGTDTDGFQYPVGICRDSNGYLYVADYNQQDRSAYLHKLSYNGSSIQEIDRVLLTAMHSVVYNETLDKVIAFGYTNQNCYLIEPSDLTYTTYSLNGKSFANSAVVTNDGTTVYLLNGKNYIYKGSFNSSVYPIRIDWEQETIAGKINSFEGNDSYGICLTDDENYLIVIGHSGNVYKVKLSDKSVEKIVENNELADGYLLTNNGSNHISFVGYGGRRICEMQV